MRPRRPAYPVARGRREPQRIVQGPDRLEHEGDGACVGWLCPRHVAAGTPAGVRSSALDRSLGPLGFGTYNVKVQVKVTNAKMIIEPTDWHLTVERVRV